MPEYEKYLERAYEVLDSAKILFENEKYNSSVAQAYYAMFYAAKALLSVKDIHPKTHRGVIAEFGLEFINKGFIEEMYGKTIAKGLQLRERADYDVYYKASRDEAEDIIKDAERFTERIREAIDKIVRQSTK